jgi:hypothetical protein
MLRHEGADLKINEISLQISSKTIINLLADVHSEALYFFYFLGMLP